MAQLLRKGDVDVKEMIEKEERFKKKQDNSLRKSILAYKGKWSNSNPSAGNLYELRIIKKSDRHYRCGRLEEHIHPPNQEEFDQYLKNCSEGSKKPFVWCCDVGFSDLYL